MVCRFALLTLALALFGSASSGAELFYMDHDPFTDEYVGPVGPLVLSGEIMPGDCDRLLARIAGDEARFLSQNKIILASDGGDVAEALKIANLVNSLFTEIIVERRTGRCASACFFVYAAANQRGTDGEHLIGINRPYFIDSTTSLPPADAAAVEDTALSQVRIFLKDNEVPGYLIEEMFRHPSNDAYWLSALDEASLGYKSASFQRFLADNCAWNDSMEQEVFARKRPFEELVQMMRCRARVTQLAAHKALAQAAASKAPRPSHAKRRSITDGPAESAPPRSSSE
jgi:hypothetical protein